MRESAAKVELNALKKAKAEAEAEELARRIKANEAYTAKAVEAMRRGNVTTDLRHMSRTSPLAGALLGVRNAGLFFGVDKLPGAQKVYNTLASGVLKQKK